MDTLLLFIAIAVVAAIAAGVLAARWFRQRRRWGLLRDVMDSADALELQLTRTRRLLDGIASSDNADAALRDVLHDLLRQRMWLQQHGMHADIAELEEVRSRLDAGRRRLGGQTAA